MNVFANLARVISATVGVGTLTLGGAVSGSNTFDDAGVANGSVVTYYIEDYDGTGAIVAREIGVGTYTTATKTLTRTTVYASSSGGARIFCSGRQHVGITPAKEDFDTVLELSDLGTSGAKIPLLNTANTWTGTQTISTAAATAVLMVTSSASFAIPVTISSTNADAIGGPGLQFFRDSPSPAANDEIGFFNFRGNNSAAAGINYVQILATILDHTSGSEDSRFRVNVYTAGVQETALTARNGVFIGSPTGFAMGTGTLNAVSLYENGTLLTSKYGQLATSNSWQAQNIFSSTTNISNVLAISTDASAAAGPFISVRRAGGSPAAADAIGGFNFQGENNALGNINYGQLQAEIVSPTTGSESGRFVINTIISGTLTKRMTIEQSVIIGTGSALATTATDGFLYIPTCAGTPTGVPTAVTGGSPLVIDSTNNKLYFYSGGAWRDAGP